MQRRSPPDIACLMSRPDGADAGSCGLVGPSGEIVAGDISSTMLEVARRNLKDTPIRFDRFDGQSLPFPDKRFNGSSVSWAWLSLQTLREGLPNSTAFWCRADGPR